MRILAAPDKFRGTATAAQVAGAIASAARALGVQCREVPLSDGGEGFLDVFGGPNRFTVVTPPNPGDANRPAGMAGGAGGTGSERGVEAGWRLDGRTAVIEMAMASGLELAGGALRNDPLEATTFGTGELIDAAVSAGARRVIVGLGGSATTDGGLGALRALYPTARLRGIELVAAVDVETRFTLAADVFAAQKGATPSQVALLRGRLERLAQVYLDEYGVDVDSLVGSGAAGGLAGGLAAVGARIQSGFDLIADELDLLGAMERVDLVVTGEGFVDSASFEGKVVGGVVSLASELGVPVLVVAGELFDDVTSRLPPGDRAVSLVARFGRDRSMDDPLACIAEVVADHIELRHR